MGSGKQNLLVPLVHCEVVDKNWFDLHCAKEMVVGNAVIDVESDDGVFGSDIAGCMIECTRALRRRSAYKETSCFHTGL